MSLRWHLLISICPIYFKTHLSHYKFILLTISSFRYLFIFKREEWWYVGFWNVILLYSYKFFSSCLHIHRHSGNKKNKAKCMKLVLKQQPYNNNGNDNDIRMIMMMSIMILTVMITYTMTWNKKKSRLYTNKGVLFSIFSFAVTPT